MKATPTALAVPRPRAPQPSDSPHVLLADDDPSLVEALRKALTGEGFQVTVAKDGDEAVRRTLAEGPEVALIDVRMPGTEGIPLLRKLQEAEPAMPVVLMTGYASISTAVEAIRLGAYDFMEKPLRREQLVPLLRKAVDLRRMRGEIRRLREELQQLKLSPIVGRSQGLRRVLQQISSVAATPSTTVLVQGESGTGKELVARAIHDASARREKPFVAVNCAALTEPLLEAELFGYEKGAFTGASPAGKQGLFAAAEGGTVFLDEVSELAPALQAKLLRTLQERTIRRVGGERDIGVNVRTVASTNRDLGAAVSAGRFRQDLFFRLHVMTIEVPPLRERKEDLPLLAHFFLENYNREIGKALSGFSAEAMQAFLDYEWPGNVRELRNAVERAAIVSRGPLIQASDLLLRFRTAEGPSAAPASEIRLPGSDRSIRALERTLIEQVLRETGGNISRSAEILGINRTTLYNKMRLYSVAGP